MFNFAAGKENMMQKDIIHTIHALDDEVMYVNNLKEVSNLPQMRMTYNSIVYCRGGRILVEVGGNNQVHVKPGQLRLVPVGKLVQPMLISTDVEASALFISDRQLKLLLGNQINIWNKAMYTKEIYVVDKADWVVNFQASTRTIFHPEKDYHLYREISSSFLRVMLLLICEELMRHETMTLESDLSTSHDKELFNRFLNLLNQQEQKRQRISFYADRMNITSKYLSAICKRVSGKSSMRWITDSVMQDSYSLLKDTDLSVKEISNRLGFPNASFFGQYFREQAGSTPIEYRTEHKQMAR